MWKKANKEVSVERDELLGYFTKILMRPKPQLEAALAGEADWNKQLELAGIGVSGNLVRSEAQLPQYLRKRQSKGIRKLGGGRKSEVAFMYPAVKVWFENERSQGNFVDKDDLVDEFQNVMNEVLLQLKVQGNQRPLSKREHRIIDNIEEK